MITIFQFHPLQHLNTKNNKINYLERVVSFQIFHKAMRPKS
jgi:hypothetical protein